LQNEIGEGPGGGSSAWPTQGAHEFDILEWTPKYGLFESNAIWEPDTGLNGLGYNSCNFWPEGGHPACQGPSKLRRDKGCNGSYDSGTRYADRWGSDHSDAESYVWQRHMSWHNAPEPHDTNMFGCDGSSTFNHNGWYTVGYNWTNSAIQVSINGAVQHELDITRAGLEAWSNYDQFLIMNIAYGGALGCKFEPDPAACINQISNWDKQTMEVDYVRYYQQGASDSCGGGGGSSGPVCGNGSCESGEDCGSCSSDCGTCGGGGAGVGDTVQAESGTFNATACAGVGVCTENGGTSVGYFDAGDYMAFSNMNLDGATGMDLRIAGEVAGGVMQVRADSCGGTLLGSYTMQATGGWATWADRSMSFSGSASGTHTLYLCGVSGSGILNIDHFKLTGGAAAVCGQNGCEAGESCGSCAYDCGACSGTAVVHQHCNASGFAVALNPGDYTLGQLQALGIGDNTASELDVAAGYEMVLYNGDNFTGESTILTGSTSCLTGYSGGLASGTWNDKITSLRVRAIGGGGPDYSVGDTIQGEAFDLQSGIGTEGCSEGGLNLMDIGNGEWAAYENVSFDGVGSFEVRCATAIHAGTVEFRRGGVGGTLLATCSCPFTGGWQSWTTASCNAAASSGTDTLYTVFRGAGQYSQNPNVNWVKMLSGSSGPVCGNGSCESGESCSSCSSDCGSCGPVCGNGSCESGEDCNSCSSDCGTCGGGGCSGVPNWDVNKPWYNYVVGEQVQDGGQKWTCNNTAYCYYQPTGPYGTYGWSSAGGC
jgi:hypothetical protein